MPNVTIWFVIKISNFSCTYAILNLNSYFKSTAGPSFEYVTSKIPEKSTKFRKKNGVAD